MKILRVDSSARMEESVSRRLADRIVSALEKREGPVEILRRDLGTQPPPLLDGEVVAAFGTSPDERSESQQDRLAMSVRLIEELRAVDLLVLATPIYNFGIPASLKAWIDLVVRARETFRYTTKGPKGLLAGRRAIVALASGGTAVDGPNDFATPYLRRVLDFVGVDLVRVFAADELVQSGEQRILSVEAEIDAGLLVDDWSCAPSAAVGEDRSSLAEREGPRAVEGYHAHVYGEATGAGEDLAELRARAGRELSRERIGRLRSEPVGPHPRPMFQIAFAPTRLEAVLPWLIERRSGRSVLIHPLHGRPLAEHTVDALWLGRPLDLDVSVF